MSNIKIFFAGDFCSKPSTSHISVDPALKKEIQTCDLRIVNFEVPLKPNIQLPKIPRERFFQNDDTPKFLKEMGFNLFQIANNHIFDWGYEGYKRVREAFGDSTFGAGTYDEALQIKVVEVKEKKIGFLALCYKARSGVFSDYLNQEGLGCAHIYDPKVTHIIHEAKQTLDYLFILPHAGIEYTDAPIPELIVLYRDWIEWGADGILASHPHCPQGYEIYKGKPIFYSLGNLFFNSKPNVDFVAKRPHWYEGLCVVIELSEKIDFRIINTRNTANQGIVVDKSPERAVHNQMICKLISNKEHYAAYYNRMQTQMDQLERTIILGLLSKSFGFMTHTFVSYFINLIRGRKKVMQENLQSIIGNDTTLSLFRKKVQNIL